MRKALSIVLALAMIMSLSITAFADETGVAAGSYNTDVTGTYVEGTTSSGTVFSVDITWAGMSFTYYAEKAPVWNAENHTYSEKQDAYWEGEGTITVTNHSNAKITATPAYVKEAGYESAEITFSKDVLNVGSAAAANAAVSGEITATPSGSLPAGANGTKIGTITVTIAQDTNVTAADVTALYNAANGRMATWTAAGLEVDAQSLLNSLADVQAAANVGETAISQEILNSEYARLLAAYNELEAKVNG